MASTQVHDTEVALIVPTADLANHSFQYNSTYALRTARGAFELNSRRPLNAGDAICISYGSDKTNAELMRDYGEFDTLMTAYELCQPLEVFVFSHDQEDCQACCCCTVNCGVALLWLSNNNYLQAFQLIVFGQVSTVAVACVL